MRTGPTAYFAGLAAEEIAARLYKGRGGSVIAVRWRCPEGEIDLVVAEAGVIVFVEVKARRRRDAAAGSISAAQWRRLEAAAERYLAENTDGGSDCRFDVVLIDGRGICERIENAHAFDAW